MSRGKLTDEHRTFIVTALACHDTPSEVAEAVKNEFKIEVSKQSVEAYDPTKRAGRNLAAKWVAIFEATRKAFLENTTAIPIANRAVRLRAIQRMAEKAEKQKNYALAAQLYEQAAKEVGEAYTNKRQITGKDGGPIQTEGVTTHKLADSDAELVKRFLG